MSPTEPIPRRIAWLAPWTWKRRWWVLAVALAMFVAYPLSAGPAFLMAMRGPLPIRVFLVFYAPLRGWSDWSDEMFISYIMRFWHPFR